MSTAELVWVSVGAVAQVGFGARMIVQWWASERAGRSVVPVSFWFLSVAASVMMLAYACYRRDPVFIAGQLLGLAVYARNLMLLFQPRTTVAEAPPTAVPSPATTRNLSAARECHCPCTCGARLPDRPAIQRRAA